MKRYKVYKIVAVDRKNTSIKRSFVLDRDSSFCLHYSTDHYTVPKKDSLILTFGKKIDAQLFANDEGFSRPAGFSGGYGYTCEIWEAVSHWKPVPVLVICEVQSDIFKRFWETWNKMSLSVRTEYLYHHFSRTRNAPSGTLGCKDLKLVRKVTTLTK